MSSFHSELRAFGNYEDEWQNHGGARSALRHRPFERLAAGLNPRPRSLVSLGHPRSLAGTGAWAGAGVGQVRGAGAGAPAGEGGGGGGGVGGGGNGCGDGNGAGTLVETGPGT